MIKVYNTLSKKKEVLKPLKDKKLDIFVCGPTVYDFSHIGHARTYIIFDVIVNYLKDQGFKVFYLQNITDIDDKIIKRAKERDKNWKEIAEKFEKEYLKDMKDLGVSSVNKYAKATDYIKEIESQVERLIKKGFAYKLEDGIYYDISKFKDYGKLSKRKAEKSEDAVSRIDDSKNKRNKGDFCLWKFSKPNEPSWKSDLGKGRPGWHIEDTAITEKEFGFQYDAHGGARDLIFPHHEAEISQMEALSNKKPMAKYWLHTGFLRVEGRKMSKSLGNFITIRDFLKENSPRLLRFLIIKSHYRSPINYSKKKIIKINKELERIEEFVTRLKEVKEKKIKNNSNKIVEEARKEFQEAMNDDFNTPEAIASIFNLINKGNKLIDKNKISSKEAEGIINFIKEIDEIFKIDLTKTSYTINLKDKVKISKKLNLLISERENYRENKEWKKADEKRKEIEKLGYTIKDTKEGPKIKKFSK
jgi:cysteinyl-tRNA synthetase